MASAARPANQAAGAPAAPQPGVAALPVSNRGLLTFGVMLATIIQILDTTIANVALPHMEAALGATADTITWVLTSYIVASAIAIPITGWLSDRIGSRNLFLVSIIGFVLSSALCGMAQNLPQMVTFRILQGISAAFMNPLSQTVLLDINPPERQGKAMSIWGMGIMVGPIMGPVIGGFLTDNFNWRWVFYVNLPLGLICIGILWWLLPSRQIRRRSFDVTGFLLLSLGLASLQLMLDRGQGEDWLGSREIWIEMIVAAVALWMFLAHMITAKRPMFDRALFKNANLMASVAFMVAMGLVMMATMALLPPLLQQIYGHSVQDTGLLLMPRGIGVVLTTALAAQIIGRGVDARILIAIGFGITGYSLHTMSQWSLEMGTTPVLVAGFLQGVGMGLAFTPLNGLAFGTLPPHYRTEGASLMNLARAIGSSAGISMVTTMLARSAQTSHAMLAPHINAETLGTFDPRFLEALGETGESVMAMANAEVTRQATMIAYLNDFWAMSLVTFAAIPLALFLRKPKGPMAKPDPGAGGH